MQEADALFRTLVSAVPIGIFQTDRSGNCVYVNDALLELCDLTPDQYQGHSWQRMIHLDDLVGVKVVISPTGNQQSEFLNDYCIQTRRGTEQWIRIRVRPLLSGEQEFSGYLGTVEDITVQQRYLRELHESRELYLTTFNDAPVGIAHCGLDGRFLKVNQRLCLLTGYTDDELCDRYFQDITHPEDIRREEEILNRLKSNEWRSSVTLEKRYIRRDGEIVRVSLTVALLRSPNGEPKHFICAILDINERRQLEERLLQSQKMEAVGLLAGGIAHDFNNLLTAINGYAELMLRRDYSEERRKELAGEIRQAGQKGSALTAQLLAFSRRQVLQPRVLDLNEVIEANLSMLERVIREDIEIITALAPELWQVRADPAQIDQIILNLTVNARDAMPSVGKLIIETANVVMDDEEVSHHVGVAPGNYVLLAISDTGCGMDAETQARIFEPFFTTKESGKGAGLGLATVYGIVRQSGGDIRVYSEPNIGTTFRIYLPRVDAPVEAVEIEEQTPEGLEGTETILVAEDDEMVRRLVVTILTEFGYHALEAADPDRAILLCQTYSGAIDLLLTDVVMPHFNGCELYSRAVKLRPRMKALYMSGYTPAAITGHSLLNEEVNFLSKPFLPETLVSRIRQILDTE
jgi:PAS domain S-box-containing protein